ncbi:MULTISPECIES: hypothetical protein [Pseudomonas]|jgi:hypothetical protein|uniref:hypothetical protein n=1 Tax=Pseudomonas TaxID=286 RepID=UPI00216919C9|nr:hypothetical protein [Pseudomonas grimontii]MCS3514516.1 hypothetical protein [Pseudomonas grimontii]
MIKSELLDYLAVEISSAQQRISPKMTKSDKVDTGRLEFLTALRAVVAGSATPENLGTVGAVNDVLQKLGLLEPKKTLLNELEA